MSLPHPVPYQGSKRTLAAAIARHLPTEIGTFYEPFAGSAAMTIYAAHHRLAPRFVIADSLEPMIDLHRAIVETPEETASAYRALWHGQAKDDDDYFNRIRERYNDTGHHVDLLYLVCRCVKNSVRFSRTGRFTQSVDRRRLGMHPDRMRSAIHGVSKILHGRVEFRAGDWLETTSDARPADFVYMDPPYSGTSTGSDRRYHQQVTREQLIVGLQSLRNRSVPFALSYDGTTGEREYAPPLPETLGLTRRLLDAGTSTQSTLNGLEEKTVESLYLIPDPDPLR